MKAGQATVADTAQRALDVAERLVQVRGFNGVSYADVAAEIGVTKAALHYHFAAGSVWYSAASMPHRHIRPWRNTSR